MQPHDRISQLSTPVDPSSRLLSNGEPFHDPTLFHQIMGLLQYATITRLSIGFVVNKACQFMYSPTVQHWQATKRILRYLKGTHHHCLHFHLLKRILYLPTRMLDEFPIKRLVVPNTNMQCFMVPILSVGRLRNKELRHDQARRQNTVYSHTQLLNYCSSNN